MSFYGKDERLIKGWKEFKQECIDKDLRITFVHRKNSVTFHIDDGGYVLKLNRGNNFNWKWKKK